MATAKRRINSTGRKRISRDQLDIRMLTTGPGEPLKATANVDFGKLDFPGSAVVALEAYQSSSGMRFDCGNVANLQVPPVMQLDEIDRGRPVLFRVKVIDAEESPGKILGSAERIRPVSDQDQSGHRSIFPTHYTDLGSEVWRVNFDEAGPVLMLNNRIPGLMHRILENPLVQGMLLPAALRIVLERLAEDSVFDEEEEVSWQADWMKYCREGLGIEDDPSELADEERAAWVADGVKRFCDDRDFAENIRHSIEGGA